MVIFEGNAAQILGLFQRLPDQLICVGNFLHKKKYNNFSVH